MPQTANERGAHEMLAANAAMITKMAGSVARGLVWRTGRSPEDRYDVQQDLLAELTRRTPRFDPNRGTFQGFAGGIFKHRASEIASSYGRTRLDLVDLATIEGLEEPAAADHHRDSEFRRDLMRAVEALGARGRDVMGALLSADSEHGSIPRSTLSRHRREIRRRLRMFGIAA